MIRLPRHQLREFTDEMERRLSENEHKHTFTGSPTSMRRALERATRQIVLLTLELDEDTIECWKKAELAIDAANYLMMVWAMLMGKTTTPGDPETSPLSKCPNEVMTMKLRYRKPLSAEIFLPDGEVRNFQSEFIHGYGPNWICTRQPAEIPEGPDDYGVLHIYKSFPMVIAFKAGPGDAAFDDSIE